MYFFRFDTRRKQNDVKKSVHSEDKAGLWSEYNVAIDFIGYIAIVLVHTRNIEITIPNFSLIKKNI